MTKVSSFSSKFYKISEFPFETYSSPFTISEFDGIINLFLENPNPNIQTFVSIGGGDFVSCNNSFAVQSPVQLVFKFNVESLTEETKLSLINISGDHEICSFNFRNI